MILEYFIFTGITCENMIATLVSACDTHTYMSKAILIMHLISISITVAKNEKSRMKYKSTIMFAHSTQYQNFSSGLVFSKLVENLLRKHSLNSIPILKIKNKGKKETTLTRNFDHYMPSGG